VLGLFVALGANQCLFWFSFSSAGTPGVAAYYGFGDGSVDLLLALGPVGGVLAQPLATALLSSSGGGFGLRASMRLAGCLSAACTALRLLPTLLSDSQRHSHTTATTVVLCVGQVRTICSRF